MLFSAVAVVARVAVLPDRVTWPQLLGAGCLAGIGFTMSLFVTDLALPQDVLMQQAKLGVVAASTLAACVGASILVATRRVPR